MHLSSLDKMKSFRDRFLSARSTEPLVILDVGSLDINGSYRGLFAIPPWLYTGADLVTGPNVDIVLGDPNKWPLRSGSFDVVITGQALEHMDRPWEAFLEIARVLKPGGLLCAIVPSAGPEHRHPVDCWRIMPDGMRSLAGHAGLEVLDCHRQERPLGYPDSSDWWLDTILVARKP